MEGTAGGVGRVGFDEGAWGEEVCDAGGDDDGIELDGVGGGVGLVDAVRETLGDDDDVDVEAGELVGERLGGGSAFRDGVGGQEADLETVEFEELVAEGANVDGRVVVVVGWVRLGFGDADGAGDGTGDVVADAVELHDDVLLDDGTLDVGGFEAHRVDDELLLGGDERVEKETRLRPDVGEGGRHGPREGALGGAARGREEAFAGGLVGLFGGALVGGVGVGVQRDEHLARTVAVVVVDGHARLVDGQLFKVGAAVAVELRVQVGEETALQEGILGEVDASDEVARLELTGVSTS